MDELANSELEVQSAVRKASILVTYAEACLEQNYFLSQVKSRNNFLIVSLPN